MTHWKGRKGPLLIAEIGGNHEGSFDYAMNLTNLAITSGVDYVKFQIYTGDSLVNPIESPDRNKHFKKFELSRDQHIELANRCKDSGVGYMASVWDLTALPWIDDYIDIYKIGSGDLTAYNVIKEICKLNKPLLISTGLANMQEVLDVISYIRRQGSYYQSSDSIALLQCTSMYPISYEGANLKVINSLKIATGLRVGYSDHTEGSRALEIAYAMGADILEFHFTDKREGKEFRDHKVSLEKEEVVRLIWKLKEIRELKGDFVKKPLLVEKDHHVTFRRALYPSMDIKAGTVIGEEHIVSLRPNHGIGANEYENLIGKKSVVDLKRNQKLDWDKFE